jgi:creatinine amidohydrolase
VSAARPYLLADCTWDAVRQARYDVAVLPWGATEAHNRHLPYATDTIQVDAIATEAARLAWQADAPVLVLPAVPFGVQTTQRDIPFCLNLNPSTQQAILVDLLETIEQHGIRKMVILNGHGGNDFKQIIREVQPRTPVVLVQVHWYAVVDPTPFFDEPGDHAGELETSLMQAVAPSLVGPLDAAGDGAARPSRLAAVREGWAWLPRRWTEVTRDTGVGDPRAATAAKGARYFAAVTAKIASFLVELAGADPNDLYQGTRPADLS